jgi:hypothetical protein
MLTVLPSFKSLSLLQYCHSQEVGEVVCVSNSKNDENVSEIINFNCDAHTD